MSTRDPIAHIAKALVDNNIHFLACKLDAYTDTWALLSKFPLLPPSWSPELEFDEHHFTNLRWFNTLGLSKFIADWFRSFIFSHIS